MNPEFIEEYVQRIVWSLEPSPEEKAGAKRSHHALRSAMDSGNMGRRIVTSYLSGSYARHTAIRPIEDVAIIFVIEPSCWPEPTPDKVLQTFAGAIRLRRDQSRVQVQRRSVGLIMNHLSIDVVPAIETQHQGYVRIPDRESGEWILTAPQIHSQAATEVNRRRAAMFIPLVKLLKGWNSSLPTTVRLKSFSIETMAVYIFQETPFASLFDGALKYFDFLCDQFAEPHSFKWPSDFGIGLRRPCFAYQLPDVAHTGSNLFANLRDERRDRFLEHAKRARDALLRASSARSAETCSRFLGGAFKQELPRRYG